MNHGLESDSTEDHGQDNGSSHRTDCNNDMEMEDSMELDLNDDADADELTIVAAAAFATTTADNTIETVNAPQRPLPSRLVTTSILRTGSYDEATTTTRATATVAMLAGSYHHHRQQAAAAASTSSKESSMVSFQQETTTQTEAESTAALSVMMGAPLHASFDVSQLDGYHSKRHQLERSHHPTQQQQQQQQQQSPFRELFPSQSPQQHRPLLYTSASWEEHHEEIATSPPATSTRKPTRHAPTSANRRNSPGQHYSHHPAKTPVRPARLRFINKTPGKRTPASAKRKHRYSGATATAATTSSTITTSTMTSTTTTVTTPTSTSKSLHHHHHHHHRQSPVLKRGLSSCSKIPQEQQQPATATTGSSWSGQHSDMPPPSLPAASTATTAAASTRDTSINYSSCTSFSVLWKEDVMVDKGNHDGGGIMTTATPCLKKPAKLSLGTVTTAASSAAQHLLDTTDDSIETTTNTSSDGGGTPFRFTSFPASLPRINTLRTTTTTATTTSSAATTNAGPSCHGTVRKRMSFGEPQPVYPSQHYQAQQQQQQYHNQFSHNNNNNDMMMMLNRSHDTSLSSVPDDGQYGYSDNDEDDDDDINLLQDDNDERLSNASPIGTPVARARLNFSSAVSPQAGVTTASASVASCAASSASSHKPIGNSMASPLRNHHLDNSSCSSSSQDHHLLLQQERQTHQEAPSVQARRPGTPTEVKIHFAGGVQCCSPIRGIPEEDRDDDLCSSKASSTNAATKEARKGDTALSTSRESSCSGGASTSEGSSCNSSKKRVRQRPMPDMNAFDGDAITTSASSSLLSRDRSGAGGGDDTITTAASNASQQPPPSPKLLCPPTPVRTPAWAHCETSLSVGHHHSLFKKPGAKFGRQNSLIATKVLATCSPQVLDGRTSLENSILEEEQRSHGSNGSTHYEQQQQKGSLSSSMTTLPRGKTDASAANPAQDTDVAMSEGDNHRGHGQGEDDWFHNDAKHGAGTADSSHNHHSKLDTRRSLNGNNSNGEPQAPAVNAVVSMSTSFDILSLLGSGTFADVYKVRSKTNGKLYAVKKNRRHFRGRRDREKALSEVRYMQRLQSVCASNMDSNNVNNRSKMATTSYSLYLLFFYQAWQEEGHFFCQTELCCRDTSRELMDALRSDWCRAQARYPCLRRLAPPPQSSSADNQQNTLGRLMPESTIWKICHDISGGLSHIHSHGLVHHDIKPSNMFFVSHSRFGAMCKIGDFGMAGDIGSSEDGQEGDQKYMAPELLAFSEKHASADIFSLGLTLYEMASALSFEVPSEGPRWHEVRRGGPQLFDHHHIPPSRDAALIALIRSMLNPDSDQRPAADDILRRAKVQQAGMECEEFLRDYIHDLEAFDFRQEQEQASLQVYSVSTNNNNNTSVRHATTEKDEQTPTTVGRRLRNCLSPMTALPPVGPMLYSPEVAPS